MKEFSALLYTKNDSTPVSVQILFENKEICFNFYSQLKRISIEEIEISLGGENNSFIILKNEEFIFYFKDESIFAILEKYIEPQKIISLKKDKSKAKKELNKVFVYLFSTLMIFIISGILIFNFLLSFFIKSFPVSWEEKLGEKVFSAMVEKNKIILDKNVSLPLETLGKHLHKYSNDTNYQPSFYVVKDTQVNAFALPGGKIVVFTGLIEKSDSIDEVASVLAHELNHVYERHGIARIVKRFGVSIAISMIFGDISGIVYTISGDLLSLKFDRDEEREADKKGLELLYDSGFNPKAMPSFFKKLRENEGNTPEIISLISTHPATEERIENMNKLIREKYSNNKKANRRKFDFDWQKIKKLVKS